MNKINIRRLYYHVRHKYFTLNYIVIAVALFIAASWAWGALGVMQKNYGLEKQVDYEQQELQLAQLQTQNLQLEQNYYKTSEYQELAARQDLGLGLPGESVLILPSNSQSVINADNAADAATMANPPETSDFQQWVDFLFGGNSKSLSGE